MREVNNDNEEEIVPEQDDSAHADDTQIANGEETVANKIKDLRQKLKRCQDDRKQAQEDLLRTRADFLNSKRRLEEQLERDRERATDTLLMELISLVDSFDQAMADKGAWEKVDEHWRNGFLAIKGRLVIILRTYNIDVIDPLGMPFNPEEHEAVSSATVTDDALVDTITAVLQKGYRRNGTVLRPARVMVGRK